MKIEIFCSGCKQELKIEDSNINTLGSLELSVQTCHNKNCYVCGDCEEVEAREKAELKLEVIKEELETINNKEEIDK